MADEQTDALLLAALRDGDVRAFETLFLRYNARLCGFAYTYVESEAVAEELVQDALFFVWKHRTSLEVSGEALPRYLFAAVRNSAVSHLRHRQVEERGVVDVVALARSPAPTDRDAEQTELAAAVQHAVAHLPERCRAVFALHRQQGMSYNEIAETLGISPKTVEVHMGNAFKLLRKSLAQFRRSE